MNELLKLRITPAEGTVAGDKRQHFPAVLHWTCPKCGAVHEQNYYGDYYLSYPILNGEVEATLYCEEELKDGSYCYEEFTVKLRTGLTLELVGEEKDEVFVDDADDCPFIRESETSPSFLCMVESMPGDCVGLNHKDCPVRRGITVRKRGAS